MNHQDHVQLLQGGVPSPQPDGVWADLGSGWGAFTLALADLLGPGATIYSVDKDRSSLREQEGEVHRRFPGTKMHYMQADFTKRLDLPALDGIVMANALHFVRRKEPVLEMLRAYLKPDGRLILVEYNARFGQSMGAIPIVVWHVGAIGGADRIRVDQAAQYGTQQVSARDLLGGERGAIGLKHSGGSDIHLTLHYAPCYFTVKAPPSLWPNTSG